ncbi:MAG: hypothetical protein ACM3S2_19005 [Ignavibacteriales bacterium]
MKQMRPRVIVSIPILLSLFFTGCFDKPEDFVAPVWDVNMNIPVFNKTYTLKDAIEKDTSMIRWYPAGSPKQNLLYYADKKTLETVTVGDNIKIDNPVASTQAMQIGELNVKVPSAQTATVGFDWTSVQPGTNAPFPPLSNKTTTVVFPQTNEFNYIVLSGGSLDLYVTNNMPSSVNISLSGMYLQNEYNTMKVGEQNTPYTIPGGQVQKITIPLYTGTKIYNQLSFHCVIATNGSNGNFITIPQNCLSVLSSFSNLTVTEVQGKLKVNNLNISNSFQIDDSTKFQSVEIDHGNLKLTVNNNIDVGMNAKIRLLNLYSDKSSNTPFELNLRIDRKSSQTINQDLSNFALKANTPSNIISYEVLATTDSTSDYRVIKSTDSFNETVTMSQLSLRQFTGVIKPTKLDIKPTTVSLDLGDMKDKFKFNKINFKDPDIKLYLKPSAQFKVKIDGIVRAKGSSNVLRFTDYISRTSSQVDSTVVIPSADLASFLSGFTPNLPTELTISGVATVNPDYSPVPSSISQNDYLTGSAEINFPLNIGIDDGKFSDTSKVDLEGIKDDLKKVKSVIVTLDITNGLPAKLKYDGFMLDATKNIKLLNLPPNKQAGNNFIEVPAATVDENGKVTAPAVKQEVIELFGSDIENFANSYFISSNVVVNTSGSVTGNPLPVEFKITDAVKIHASCKLVYRVNE